MLLSAAKVGLAVLAGWVQGGLTNREQQAWSRIEPSLAYVGAEGKNEAVCVLIGDDGIFIAQKDAIKSDTVDGTAGTRHITLKRLAEDPATGMVLLQASPWTYGQAHPIYLPAKPATQGQPLFVALPTGPIRAEFVRSDKIGVVTSSHRMFLMNEVKFEAPESVVAGGIVLTQNGELVGAVSATLKTQNEQQQARGLAVPTMPKSSGGSSSTSAASVRAT
jgi:hypothetical protein